MSHNSTTVFHGMTNKIMIYSIFHRHDSSNIQINSNHKHNKITNTGWRKKAI